MPDSRVFCETFCLSPEGILKEFLEKNRAEVKKMSIYEYDQEKHIRMERQDAWEDGMQEGEQQGIKNSLQTLMETMSWTAKEAMDALRIKEEERSLYMELLENKKNS